MPKHVLMQFAPHVPASAIKQSAAHGILCFVGQVGIEDNAFEFFAIAIVFFLVKLVFQKFGDNFRFGDAALENHATSFHRRVLMERKKGSETRSSISNISIICTTITCRKLECNT